MTSRISVVIPVYNRASLIEDTLQSIVRQSLAPAHVILVDNASTDNSLAILREFASRTLPFPVTVLSESIPGASAARNRGLQAVTTPFVLFFDSDDIMTPDHIRLTQNCFDRPDHPELITWKVRTHFSDRSSIISRLPHGDIVTSHLVHACCATLSMAMTTDLAIRAGGWDPAILRWDDFEFGLRLLLARPRVAVDDRIAAEINRHGESMTGTGFSQKKGEWEKALDAMEQAIASSAAPEAAKWKNWITYRRVILSAHYARETGRPCFPQSNVEHLPLILRLALRTIYHYTRRGGRGAYLFFRLFNGW